MKITYFKVKKGKVTDLNDIKKRLVKYGIPALVIFQTSTGNVYAANEIKEGLKPIIKTLQDLADPVAYCFMIYGGIKYITGHATEGQKMIGQAIGGFILIQWIPWIFELIKKVGHPGGGL